MMLMIVERLLMIYMLCDYLVSGPPLMFVFIRSLILDNQKSGIVESVSIILNGHWDRTVYCYIQRFAASYRTSFLSLTKDSSYNTSHHPTISSHAVATSDADGRWVGSFPQHFWVKPDTLSDISAGILGLSPSTIRWRSSPCAAWLTWPQGGLVV